MALFVKCMVIQFKVKQDTMHYVIQSTGENAIYIFLKFLNNNSSKKKV